MAQTKLGIVAWRPERTYRITITTWDGQEVYTTAHGWETAVEILTILKEQGHTPKLRTEKDTP